MLQYRLAKINELKSIAKLFSDSFKEYPFFDLLIPANKKEADFLYNLLYVNTKAYFKQHCCLVAVMDEEVVGACLLKHPKKPEVGVMDYLFAGGVKLLFSGGISCIRNLLKVTKESHKMIDKLNTPYWYLEAFAIAPSHQNQKLGSKMLNNIVIPYVSKNGGGTLALITHTKSNQLFYKKNGFVSFDDFQIKGNGHELTNWNFKMEIN